jgi:hypothetical protein
MKILEKVARIKNIARINRFNIVENSKKVSINSKFIKKRKY